MRIAFLIGFYFLSSTLAVAQVSSGAYNLVLKTLLSHSVKEISVEEAHKLKNVIFLDAREQKEFDVSHVKGAYAVGYENFNLQRVKTLVNQKQPIVVYCSVGYRSEKIAEQLIKAGFKNTTNLYGGIFEWMNQGYKVVDKNGNVTNRIHAYDRTWGVWLNEGVKVYD